MDLIVRNARLSHAPDAPPVDIGVAAGRIAAIEPALQADGPVFDAARLSGLRRVGRDAYPSGQVLHHRPLRAGERAAGQFHAARGGGEAHVHRRGRV